MAFSAPAQNRILVQDNTQEGIVDLNLAIVLDEAQFPEFVREKIDPGPRCANHLRQHLLRYFGKRFVGMARRASRISPPVWRKQIDVEVLPLLLQNQAFHTTVRIDMKIAIFSYRKARERKTSLILTPSAVKVRRKLAYRDQHLW